MYMLFSLATRTERAKYFHYLIPIEFLQLSLANHFRPGLSKLIIMTLSHIDYISGWLSHFRFPRARRVAYDEIIELHAFCN